MKALELSVPQQGTSALPSRRKMTSDDEASFQREMQRLSREPEEPQAKGVSALSGLVKEPHMLGSPEASLLRAPPWQSIPTQGSQAFDRSLRSEGSARDGFELIKEPHMLGSPEAFMLRTPPRQSVPIKGSQAFDRSLRSEGSARDGFELVKEPHMLGSPEAFMLRTPPRQSAPIKGSQAFDRSLRSEGSARDGFELVKEPHMLGSREPMASPTSSRPIGHSPDFSGDDRSSRPSPLRGTRRSALSPLSTLTTVREKHGTKEPVDGQVQLHEPSTSTPPFEPPRPALDDEFGPMLRRPPTMGSGSSQRSPSRAEETLQQLMRSLRAVGLSGRRSPVAERGEGGLDGLEQRLAQTEQLGQQLHDVMTTRLSHHAGSAAAALDDSWRADLLSADVSPVATPPEALHSTEERAALAPVKARTDVAAPAMGDHLVTQPHVPPPSAEMVTTAPTPSPSDFLLERVLDTLDARVQLSAEEARVSVEIEGHGEVELALRLQGHAISVAVQGAGTAAIEARALELRAALAAQGIQLEHLEFRGGDTGSGPFTGRDTSSGGRDDTGSQERHQTARDESAHDVNPSSARRPPGRGVHVKA